LKPPTSKSFQGHERPPEISLEKNFGSGKPAWQEQAVPEGPGGFQHQGDYQ